MLRSAAGRATALVFMVSGILTGTLSSRWPWLAGRLHLTSGVIGALGLAATAGALVTMPFAARFVHRYGARAATWVLTVATGITLALTPFAPGVAVLTVIFVLMGAATGTADNAMNTAGVEAERNTRRTIMSGLHGMWSVGVLVGALAGSLAAKVGLDPRIQFAAMGALIAVSGIACAPWLAGDPAGPPVVGSPVVGSAAPVKVPIFVWPRGLVLLIGLVAFAAVFVEFAASSWAALFMHWTLHTSQAIAALATAVFALAMAAGRLAGDYVVGRVGAVLSVRVCGVLGTAGCLLVAVAPNIGLALLGFVLIGIGVSVVVPLVFAAAGHYGPSPAVGVAGVATISYGAGLAAPSMMGGVAEISSLRVAFGLAAVIAVAIAAGAGLLGRTGAEARTFAPAEG
jgi:MFS family permease